LAAVGNEWSTLFNAAFTGSRNPMVLLDSRRCCVAANGAYLTLLGYRAGELLGRPIYHLAPGGALLSPAEWDAAIAKGDFAGEGELVAADGGTVSVQFAATVEVVTGHRLILVVALSTARWGARFRRTVVPGETSRPLSYREQEVVRLVALGNSGPEIADELHIAHDTVRTHTRNAMAKVGARSRAQLVAKALGEGLFLD